MSNLFGLKAVLLLTLASLPFTAFAQDAAPKTATSHFAGAVSVTQNGISLIPTFTLGKPAAIFDLSVGKKRLFFEPQLRFALEGKPWSFIFWWRYKFLKINKFSGTIGAHPSLVFKTGPLESNGQTRDYITAQRYLAVELAPNYAITQTFSMGMYYLYSHGLESYTVQNTHFLTLNSVISNIPILKLATLRLAPQVYYLKMDKREGYYANLTATLSRPKWPLTLSTLLNKAIKSNILGSKDFVWNVTLAYVFHKKYAEL